MFFIPHECWGGQGFPEGLKSMCGSEGGGGGWSVASFLVKKIGGGLLLEPTGTAGDRGEPSPPTNKSPSLLLSSSSLPLAQYAPSSGRDQNKSRLVSGSVSLDLPSSFIAAFASAVKVTWELKVYCKFVFHNNNKTFLGFFKPPDGLWSIYFILFLPNPETSQRLEVVTDCTADDSCSAKEKVAKNNVGNARKCP